MSRGRSVALCLAAIVAGASASSGQTITRVVSFETIGGTSARGEGLFLSASLWSEREGGDLVWREDLGEVFIEGGPASLPLELGSVTPFPTDAEELWLELEADGQPLGPRTRAHLSSDAIVEGRLAITTGITFGDAFPVETNVDYFSDDFEVKNFGGGEISFWTEVLDRLAAAEVVLVPATVLGELEAGFELGSRARENRVALAEFLAEPFVETVATTPEVARHYGRLFARLRRAGTPIPINDVWVAAAAFDSGAPLVTFDRGFTKIEGLDVSVLD